MADSEAEEKAILGEMRRSFQHQNLDTLSSLNALSCICLAQGRLEEAYDALSEVVDGRTARLGQAHSPR